MKRSVVTCTFLFTALAAWMPMVVDAACTGDFKVTAQRDLDTIKNCQRYKGNISIENTSANKLKIKGIELLEGDLTVTDNEGLQRLSFEKMQGINGQLIFSNNKALHLLDMKRLVALRSFEMSVHPALNTLAFPAGLHQVEKLSVTDTTVTQITGLKMQMMNDLVISNNIYLKTLAMSELAKINNAMTVSANSPTLNIDFSGLKSLQHGTFRNLASISLENLGRVTGDVSFITNSFSSLALPQVTDIAGTLTITNNANLKNLSLSELSHLGGALSLGNNTELRSVKAFPKLQEIDGTLDMIGSFEEVDLPVIGDVRGGLNVQTTSNKFSCEAINKLRQGVIKGNLFTCKASVAKPRSGLPGKDGLVEMSSSANMVTFPAAITTAFVVMISTFMACLIAF